MSRVASKAESLRADDDKFEGILAAYRSYPKELWDTLHAKVGLALEREIEAGSTVVSKQPKRGRARAVKGSRGRARADVNAAEDRSSRLLALLQKAPNGMTPAEAGAAIYGKDDDRGQHKARALVHHIQKKKNTKVDLVGGRWVLASHGKSSANGASSRAHADANADSAPAIVRRILRASKTPMRASEVLEAAQKEKEDVKPLAIYDALAKGARSGRIAKQGKSRSMTYAATAST